MRVLLVAFAAMLLSGCSDDPKPAKSQAPETPPAPISGRQAFQYVYGSARLWAPDAQPISVRSINLAGVKGGQGKAGAWETVFISESNSMARVYTWSAIEGEGLHKGVFPGPRQAWAPGGAERPFAAAEIKTDTPEALETAVQASSEYLEKPGKRPPLSFMLDVSGRFPSPAWRVMWGNSVSSAEYVVTVDAATGKLLAKE